MLHLLLISSPSSRVLQTNKYIREGANSDGVLQTNKYIKERPQSLMEADGLSLIACYYFMNA